MKIINQKDFENEIKEGVVLVDFFATWCGPCRMMGAILEEVDREIEGKAKIVKIDVDQNQDLARRFGVMSIPTLILFKNGQMVQKSVGVMQKNQCVDLIKKSL